MAGSPKTITMVGSSRFMAEHLAEVKRLSLAGNLVFSLACYSHASNEELTKAEADLLLLFQLEKIRLSDGIFVVNPGGYIGKTTEAEINFARMLNKEIDYLVKPEEDR